MDEEGNVKVKTPQCVAALTDNNTGNQIPLYLINIQQEIITEPDGSQYAIMVENPEESVITYKWDGEALTLIDGWLGACFWNSDLNVNNEGRWIWYGLADMQQKFQPCPYTALVPPGDLEYEDYVIAYTDPNTGTPLGATLKVGFIDDECWLKNLHPILTDFYVRGEKSNDGYIFHNQYLGLVDEVGYHAFFRPGFYVEKDGFRLIGDLPEMTMEFDTDTKTLRAPENTSWMIGAGNGKLSYFQRNDDPYLYPYIVPTNPTLCTPEQLEYIEPYPEYDIPGTFCFHLPQFDEDNKWIDTKYLNFNIYIDGEIFTFDPEVYQGLDEPITDVPYLVPAWWYDFLQYNDSFMVYIYADNYSSLGVRLNYDNGDKHANSEIAYISTTGITPIESDDKVIDHIAYYDLNGLKINDPSNGICIKVTFFTDGSRKVSKITNR